MMMSFAFDNAAYAELASYETMSYGQVAVSQQTLTVR